jgi:hypothetical protein
MDAQYAPIILWRSFQLFDDHPFQLSQAIAVGTQRRAITSTKILNLKITKNIFE